MPEPLRDPVEITAERLADIRAALKRAIEQTYGYVDPIVEHAITVALSAAERAGEHHHYLRAQQGLAADIDRTPIYPSKWRGR